MRLDSTKCFERAIMPPVLCCSPWCFIVLRTVLHFILWLMFGLLDLFVVRYKAQQQFLLLYVLCLHSHSSHYSIFFFLPFSQRPLLLFPHPLCSFSTQSLSLSLLRPSHLLYSLFFVPFSIFWLFMPVPLPLTSSLCQIQYVGSLISWGNRRKSTLTPLFIHSPSSPTICPSTASDPATKWNCPSFNHKNETTTQRTNMKFAFLFLSRVSRASRSLVLCSPPLSPLLSPSTESIDPLHLSLRSIRDNKGSMLH